MRDLIREFIPHAPQHGLYVAPHIPEGKLRAALEDYAPAVAAEDVLALYDATLMGSAKDGALFTADRVVFQNNDLESAHHVRYADLVGVKRKLIGGRRVLIDVNRGRATLQLSMDFSGKSGAAEFVARFLQEAMWRGADREMAAARDEETVDTDVAAVRAALEELVRRRQLAPDDFDRLVEVLQGS